MARMADRRVACRVLTYRPGEKSRLRIHRLRREYNIKMDLKEVDGGMDWIDLVQGRDR